MLDYLAIEFALGFIFVRMLGVWLLTFALEKSNLAEGVVEVYLFKLMPMPMLGL
ncbi:MAG: hypothetical protein ACJAS1_002591 [Oleiphilaceae bacterium]|jgi:hypothetical protein